MADSDPHDKPPAKPRPPVAVAIDYKQEGADDLPRVTASGRGKVAERILKLAFAAGVKVREDADLAQVLSAVEVNSVIPLEAFMAVAEILAYVYRANGSEPPATGAASVAAP